MSDTDGLGDEGRPNVPKDAIMPRPLLPVAEGRPRPGRPARRRRITEVALKPCTHVNLVTGEQCRNQTVDSSNLCPPHMRSFTEKNQDRVRKCFKCVRTEMREDGKPDIEKTRKFNCAKAFWVSSPIQTPQGRPLPVQERPDLWMRDLCWFDQQAILQPIETIDDAQKELKLILQDLKLQRNKAISLMADEGGLITPDYYRLTDAYTDLLKDFISLKKGGGQAFGRPGSEGAPLTSDADRKQFFASLMTEDDGYEKTLEITETKTTKVEAKNSPRIVPVDARIFNRPGRGPPPHPPAFFQEGEAGATPTSPTAPTPPTSPTNVATEPTLPQEGSREEASASTTPHQPSTDKDLTQEPEDP